MKLSGLVAGFLAYLALACGVVAAQHDVISLTKWKTKAGDDPRWAAPDFDDRDWREMSVPRLFQEGYRWYRTQITLPESLANVPLAIAFGPMDDAFEVFVDGTLAGSFGVIGSVPMVRFERHLSFPLPNREGLPATVSIAVRRWKPGNASWQVLSRSSPLIFHPASIGPRELVETGEQLHVLQGERSQMPIRVIALISLAIGLLALSQAIVRKHEYDLLWLGLSLGCYGISFLAAALAFDADLPKRSAVASLIVCIHFLHPAFSTLLVRQLCPRLRKLLTVTAAVQAGSAVWFAIINHFGWRYETGLWNGVDGLSMLVQMLAGAALVTGGHRHGAAFAFAISLYPAVRLGELVLIQWLALPPRFEWNGYAVAYRPLAFAVFGLTTLIILYLRSREEQEEQAEREKELAAGQRVQMSLMERSGEAPAGFAVEKAYLPAREVGGDFYRFVGREDGGLLAVVGDVSGKGLPAAMEGSRLLGALDLLGAASPAEVLTQLNDAIAEGRSGGFVTCCCALFAQDGTVTIANAGHLAPYLEGRELEVEAGLPLGVVKGVEYSESRLALDGKALTFVSDGVVEAANAKGELFGFERTRAVSGKSAGAVAEAAREWGQTDDITVVTVRRAVA